VNISEHKVRIWIVEGIGYVLGQAEDMNDIYQRVKWPFKLMSSGGDGLSVGPLLLKEEWVNLFIDKIIAELPVEEKMLGIFKKYVQKEFSRIIIPDGIIGV
jgi:hypothetical protein